MKPGSQSRTETDESGLSGASNQAPEPVKPTANQLGKLSKASNQAPEPVQSAGLGETVMYPNSAT